MPADGKLDSAEQKQLAIVGLIYKKVNDLLGAGNQLFSMQFPAQSLNYRQYQYDTNDRSSILTRPYTVAEAEFRLCDQLFDVYPITQAPTGEKLSVVYNTLLNNYVPSLKPFAAYFRDRAGLSNFLLQEKNHSNGTPKSRIDWCKELYNQYLQAKLEWETDKNLTFDEIKDLSEQEDSGVTLDDYARWLSSEGLVREEELNNLYNDAIVKGHFHEVLTILGYLNVSSLAEELELAKQRMRHSMRLSLDESMLVYPVQFQPSNWFQGLAPNLSPVDLTMAHETIRDLLRAKRRELSRAQSDLQVLEIISSNGDEIKNLETKVAEGKKKLSDAESNLVEKYGQAAVTAAKIYLSTLAEAGSLLALAEMDTVAAVDPKTLADLGLSEDQILEELQTVVTQLHNTYKEQKEVLQQAEELTYLKAQLARAKSHDVQFEKINLNQHIRELRTDIDELGQLIAGVYREKKNPKGSVTVERDKNDKKKWTIQLPGSPKGGVFKLKVKIQGETIQSQTSSDIAFDANESALSNALKACLGDHDAVESVTMPLESKNTWNVTFRDEKIEMSGDGAGLTVAESTVELPVIPSSGNVTEADGMFMDVVIKSTEIADSSSKVETASASEFGWNVRGWFFSAGGQHSSLQASTDAERQFFGQDITIGFRVAKVTFDRGGWFNPQIFKMSHAFYRLADLKASPSGQEITKDKVLDAAKAEDNPSGKVAELLKDGENRSILPAYPVGMVIAKDITIKVRQDASQSEMARTVIENSNTAGGGFLGFSCTYSSANSSTNDKTFFGQQGDYFYIRIPGPQILGYYLQFVPPDKAMPYEAIFQEEKDTEVEKALAAYDFPPQLPTSGTTDQPVVTPEKQPENDKS